LPSQLAWQAPAPQRNSLSRQLWASFPHRREHGPPAQVRLNWLQDLLPVHCTEQAWSPGHCTLENEQLSLDSHDTTQWKPAGQASVDGLPELPVQGRSALQRMVHVPATHSSHTEGQAAPEGAAAAGQSVGSLDLGSPGAFASALPASRLSVKVVRRSSASSERCRTQVGASLRLSSHTQPGRHGQGLPSSAPRSKSETQPPLT